jgi:adenylate cyclase
VQQLIESREDSRVGGIRKQVVVIFSDIENFTSIAEKMDPNELMEQICQYFDELSNIIISQKGTIDKYIGDSIMAFWGAPLMVKNPCDHAAKAALLCQKKIEELNKEWTKQGKPSFITRIGIHKGEAIVGNVGSSERLNYTALGDTINMTSRIEKINKIYNTNIIVSDSVYEEIKDRFTLRRIDTVVLTGRTAAIDIYELLAEKHNAIKG